MQQPSQKPQLAARQSNKGAQPQKSSKGPRAPKFQSEQKQAALPPPTNKTFLPPSSSYNNNGERRQTSSLYRGTSPYNGGVTARVYHPRPCRLFVKAEIFVNDIALKVRQSPPASSTVPSKKVASSQKSSAPPVTLSILVSLSNTDPLSSLFTKVESDFSHKHAGESIKCRTLLIDDCFEIVDVAKSQVQAYLTDMMHVTILATKAQASSAPAARPISEQKKVKNQVVEKTQQVSAPTKEAPQKKEKAAPKKKVEVETRALKKHKLSSSVNLSSSQHSQEECESVPVKTAKKVSKKSSISSESSDLSVKKAAAETPIKRQKKSVDETGSVKSKEAKPIVAAKVDLAKVVTPAKKPSADDTVVPVEDTATKGESKNQRRKRERKEQNKLNNQQQKVVAKTAAAQPAAVTPTPALLKQVSKDGKIKSKNYNLFENYAEQEEAANSQKVVESDDSDVDGEASDGSEASEKLRKTIEQSINSYSIDDANSDKEDSPKKASRKSSLKTTTPVKASVTPKVAAATVDDEISSFSDEENI